MVSTRSDTTESASHEASPAGARDAPLAPEFSAVIPVFNSASVLAETIAACARFFEDRRLAYEIVLVDDGSSDGSWEVLADQAAANSNILAIRLLRNYGQHTAVYCGLEYSRGRYVVTLDDDLQNPPEEIARLIERCSDSDAVFGLYAVKQHSWMRRLGSRLINRLNGQVFGQPSDLVVSNFRLLHRAVVDRMLTYRTRRPYINGLVLLCAARPSNVTVRHEPRWRGSSGYGPAQIAALIGRILFNYSSFPLRAVSVGGIVVAVASLGLSAYFAIRALVVGNRVPGWASLAVLLSFFNGVSLLVLGMLGEYVVRALDQLSGARIYEVAQLVRAGS